MEYVNNILKSKSSMDTGVNSCSLDDNISFCYNKVLGSDNSLHC